MTALLAITSATSAALMAQSALDEAVRTWLQQIKATPPVGCDFSGIFINPHGETLEVAGPAARFSRPFVNYGKIKITETIVTFPESYTEMGSYISDPSTNYFTDLIVGTPGTLTGGVGDRFIISGNFTNGSLQNTSWSTSEAELAFAGGSVHSMSLAGADAGAAFSGYVNNFAWGIFRLASGQSLSLSDGNPTPGCALYARKLVLENGLSQIASITGNGCNIYYDPTDSVNAYLAGLTYPLAGGGAIIPVAVVLKITSIAPVNSGHMLLQFLGVPNRSHTVQVSPDLMIPFTFLSSVTAGPDGTFQFEDVNANNFARRFYRLTFP